MTITTLLALWEKAMGLLRSGQLSREKRFREIIEPMFREMEPVVDDYFKLFVDARRRLDTTKKGQVSEALSTLRSHREAMLVARVKVRSMADAIAECSKERVVRQFCGAIANFFDSGVFTWQRNPSAARVLVDLLEQLDSGDIEQQIILEYVKETLRNMERRWENIANAYARARVHYLSGGLFALDQGGAPALPAGPVRYDSRAERSEVETKGNEKDV